MAVTERKISQGRGAVAAGKGGIAAGGNICGISSPKRRDDD